MYKKYPNVAMSKKFHPILGDLADTVIKLLVNLIKY